MVRHGRSLALAIAVKSAPEKLCGKEYCDTVTETVLANATADRVRSTSLLFYTDRNNFTLLAVAVILITESYML